MRLAERIKDCRCVDLIGVHQHIGSQITKLDPYIESIERSAGLVEELKNRNFDIQYFNIGGGLGIPYNGEETITPAELVDTIRPTLEATGTKILCEMGRYISGNAGALLTGVIYRKKSGDKNFIVSDAGMNDLLRPSLYNAHHEIRPVNGDGATATADLVGPVCESRRLPGPRPRAARRRRGRPARRYERRRLQLLDGLQLQLPPQTRRGVGAGRPLGRSPRARTLPRSRKRRAGPGVCVVGGFFMVEPTRTDPPPAALFILLFVALVIAVVWRWSGRPTPRR